MVSFLQNDVQTIVQNEKVRFPGLFMVGMTGFEPATPSSLTKCATKLRYIPICIYGVLGRIRTADLPLRRRTLYPAELRGQLCGNNYSRVFLNFQQK